MSRSSRSWCWSLPQRPPAPQGCGSGNRTNFKAGWISRSARSPSVTPLVRPRSSIRSRTPAARRSSRSAIRSSPWRSSRSQAAEFLAGRGAQSAQGAAGVLSAGQHVDGWQRHEAGGRPFALLKVDNLLYQVKVGDYIGQNYGRILKISETEIALREIVQTRQANGSNAQHAAAAGEGAMNQRWENLIMHTWRFRAGPRSSWLAAAGGVGPEPDPGDHQHPAGGQRSGPHRTEGAARRGAERLHRADAAAHRNRPAGHRQRPGPLDRRGQPGQPALGQRGSGGRPHPSGAQPEAASQLLDRRSRARLLVVVLQTARPVAHGRHQPHGRAGALRGEPEPRTSRCSRISTSAAA